MTSIPTRPTPAYAQWQAAIPRILENRAEAQRVINNTDVALAHAGQQMLRAGATQLEVVTALNGGAHPEEDDPHSVWFLLEAWGVVEQGDGSRPVGS